jgi:hypothetical protein
VQSIAWAGQDHALTTNSSELDIIYSDDENRSRGKSNDFNDTEDDVDGNSSCEYKSESESDDDARAWEGDDSANWNSDLIHASL